MSNVSAQPENMSLSVSSPVSRPSISNTPTHNDTTEKVPLTIQPIAERSPPQISPASIEVKAESPETVARRQKKIACIECRQQKAKCDAHEMAPNACTRCQRRNIECKLKSDYKRTFKRAKIAQMEKEYEQMRKKLQTDVQPVAQQYLPSIASFSPLPVSTTSQVPFQPITTHFISPPSTTAPPHIPLAPQSGPLLHPLSQPPIQPLSRKDSKEAPHSSFHTLVPAPTPPQPSKSSKPLVKRPHTFLGNKISSPVRVSRSKLDTSAFVCTPKSLGDVSLSSEQIKVLFEEFAKNYHDYLPVVDLSKGPERLYRLCPVLFWTIIFIALRRHRSSIITKGEANNLYFSLSPVLKSALAEITISPITRYAPTEVQEPILNVSSVYSVQAFLLYTFWPPLTSSLSADASWNSIGIAVFQAIRIGLHVPGHSSDGMKTNNKDLLNEQVKTWIGCNVVSQTIATAFGFPGFVQLDAPLLMTCKSGTELDIPDSLIQMTEIQLFEDQVAKTLNSNPLDPLRLVDATERLPLMKLLNRELDQLETKLCSDVKSPIDDLRRLSLYAARLHLSTYNFLDNERIAPFELSRGAVQAYNAALAVICHCKDAFNKDKGFIKYLPGVYVLTIWQASCILAKLVHSSYASLLDIGAGKEAYHSAIGLTMKASVIKHDMAYRSSGIMRTTWPLFKALYEHKSLSQKVTVRSRMCASVFFDCLWIVREKCGMIKLAPRRAEFSSNEIAVADDSDDSVDEGSNSNSDSEGARASLERQEEESGAAKDTPNSSVSSHHSQSQAPQRKKHRSLSNTLHPESSARKIISTIPLDPQPISLSDNTQDHSSATSSSKASPFLQQYKSPSENRRANQDANGAAGDSSTGIFPLDSWDVVNDIDSDLLFRDIDLVMNDFGFHAD